MQTGITITERIINTICEFKTDLFRIDDVLKLNPDFNSNTVRTTISRDFVKKGLVERVSKKGKLGVTYKLIRSSKLKYRELPPKEIKPIDDSNPYIKIGKAIEQLLEDKNQKIMNQEAIIAGLKKQLLDCEATVQERDRHIRDQGSKIYELNEQLRNRQGAKTIKLDELQAIVNQQ